MTDAGAVAPAEPVAPRPWWRIGLRWLAEFVVYLVIAVVVVALVRLFLIQPYLVPSGSMEETLRVDDTILAWKPATPERGMIVVFRDDLNWLPPASPAPAWKEALSWLRILPPQDEQYLVKRLIGLPGDHVTCCSPQGQIEVNGQPLDESAYLYYNNAGVATMPFDVVVPAGHFFVLGDHRDSSSDSRYHMCRGATPTPELTFPSLDTIQGRAFAVMRPLKRAQIFHVPAVFATVPAPTGSPPAAASATWSCT